MRLVVSARTPRPPRRLPNGTRHLEITEDMLSPYSESLIDPLHPWQSSKNLVPNLINKQKYVCQYRNLQFYLNHGLKLDKIHRIISFTIHSPVDETLDRSMYRAAEDGQVRLRVGLGQTAGQRYVWQDHGKREAAR